MQRWLYFGPWKIRGQCLSDTLIIIFAVDLVSARCQAYSYLCRWTLTSRAFSHPFFSLCNLHPFLKHAFLLFASVVLLDCIFVYAFLCLVASNFLDPDGIWNLTNMWPSLPFHNEIHSHFLIKFAESWALPKTWQRKLATKRHRPLMYQDFLLW